MVCKCGVWYDDGMSWECQECGREVEGGGWCAWCGGGSYWVEDDELWYTVIILDTEDDADNV